MNYVRLQQIPLPPTVNHRLMPMCMKGRGRLIKSPKFRKWEKDAAEFIHAACEPMEDKSLFVRITIRWPDKRKRDIDGPVKPLLDLIVREGFILDDSMIRAIVVQRQDADPDEYGEPGTCDITVMPYADWKVPF
ncbi:MAG: RusA family crossover junction endodeoxyribonuclease [Actinomycetales bacterium]|nr:RusA family crossover junction endodeoxyribonuclease [Actinomycetales bacterium]